MKLTRTVSLEDRVNELRVEIDAFIDRKVAEIKKDCPGIPESVLRGTLMDNADGCHCRAVLNIAEQKA